MAVVEYNKNANLDENIVETGGRQFVKLNVLKEKLEGAEFVIYRNGFKTVDQKQEKIKEYLVVNPTNKFMTWTEDENKASVFESLGGEEDVQTGEKINRKGLGIITLKGHEDINLKGLRYGTYYIEEIKAPEGYAKLTNPKEFIVGAQTYYEENISLMEIINTKLTIPETGGIGSLIFIAVGLIVVTIGVQAKRKREELA